MVKHGLDLGLDWTCKLWTGLVKHGLVKHGLVKHGLVKHDLVKHGLVKHGLVKHDLVKHGLDHIHELFCCAGLPLPPPYFAPGIGQTITR
jgi:hypothetical protein